MALVKSQNAAGMLKEAIVLDLGDLGRQAAKLQAAAEGRARKTVGDAEQEAARLVSGAHAKGHEKGLAEGTARGLAQGLEEGRKQGRAEALQQSSAEFKRLQQAWAAAAADWEARRETLDREARDAVLDLALTLAEKLVHRIIQVDRSVVVDQIANALAHVMRDQDLAVRICPQDRAVVGEALPELLREFSHLKHLHLVDDPAIGPGGCVIVYGQGRIDATIETQLQRVVELMLPDEGGSDDVAVVDGPSTAPKPAPTEGQ
ncbi:MAG: FliH/SctL family protein [Planctomycetota bacterium]|nr:FliH/SctL family protein [Planctomycetota bacterium]